MEGTGYIWLISFLESPLFKNLLSELDACRSYADPLLSPLLTSTELLRSFPPVTLVSTDIDPCLDETVAFSNKLVDAGTKVRM